jgi:hypothetical protein
MMRDDMVSDVINRAEMSRRAPIKFVPDNAQNTLAALQRRFCLTVCSHSTSCFPPLTMRIFLSFLAPLSPAPTLAPANPNVPLPTFPRTALQSAELAIEASRNSALYFENSILHANAG